MATKGSRKKMKNIIHTHKKQNKNQFIDGRNIYHYFQQTNQRWKWIDLIEVQRADFITFEEMEIWVPKKANNEMDRKKLFKT